MIEIFTQSETERTGQRRKSEVVFMLFCFITHIALCPAKDAVANSRITFS